MQVHNETPFRTAWIQGFLQDGRERVTVVVKGTYSLRDSGKLGAVQRPLLEADTFGSDPATSAPVRENDFAPFKPRCDVIVHATAYAPAGTQTTRVEVGVSVGPMRKAFAVVGPRVWRRGVFATSASAAEPFEQHPISYESAFGGIDVDPQQPERVHAFLENPSGTGFSKSGAQIDGMPLPRTEELERQVSDAAGSYAPMALGPIGRHWVQRARYAGTYDQRWLDERLPFLPDDFDPLYFQSAPTDQQLDYPNGGERVVLANLNPEGRLYAEIPHQGVIVVFIDRKGRVAEVKAVCDTVTIEPDDDVLGLVWRASVPLKRDLFELREILVLDASTHSRARVRARALGKDYHGGLDALVAARQKDEGRS